MLKGFPDHVEPQTKMQEKTAGECMVSTKLICTSIVALLYFVHAVYTIWTCAPSTFCAGLLKMPAIDTWYCNPCPGARDYLKWHY